MKLSKFLCVILILSVLGFSSCKQLVETFQIEDNSSEETLQSDNTEQNVQITVSLPSDFPLTTSNNNKRSAIASFSNITYKVVAKASGLSTVTSNSDTTNIGITLKIGHTWTITVSAYSDTTLILQGSKTVSIKGSVSETIPLSVYTDTEAKGNIELVCKISDDVVNKYRYALDSSPSESFLDITDDKAEISISDVTPGNHTLIIQFFKDNSLEYCLNTDITVYPSLTTNTWMFEEGIADGDFTLDSELVETQKNSTYFVCGENPSIYGTDITAIISESDSNSGGAYAPLKTVATAAAKCTSTSITYTIYVDGTVNETSPITIATNSKINIKSLGTSAIIQRNFSKDKSMITIASGASLTIKNIALSGNREKHSEFPTYGGGIYNEGNLEVTNCTITNCKSTYGGGIYSKSGIVVITDSIIGDESTTTATDSSYSNYAIYGGGVYVDGDGKFTLTSGTIGRNYATYGGGGIYYNSTSTESIINGGSIQYNTANSTNNKGGGGGVYIAQSRELTFSNGSISNNNATGGEFGAGVLIDNNDTSFNNPGKFIMDGENCKICNNTAGKWAGGVRVSGTFIMKAGEISGNSSYNTEGCGGVTINDTTSTFEFTGGVIKDNIRNNLLESPGIFVHTTGNTIPTFNIGGSAKVVGDNYIDYQAMNKETITITSTLTGTSPVATILPSSYTTTTQLFTNNSYISSNCNKFSIKPNGSTSWYLDATGYIQQTLAPTVNSIMNLLRAIEIAPTNGTTQTITITSDITDATNTTITSGKKIEIQSDTTERTITTSDTSIVLYTVQSGGYLTLGGGSEVLTLSGGNPDSSIDSSTSLISVSGGTLTIDSNTVIQDNYVTSEKAGGAITIYSGTVRMTGGAVTNCRAEWTGGAIFVDTNGKFHMSNGTISSCHQNNSGKNFDGGGAIYTEGETILSGSARISSCSARRGGGIRLSGGTFKMSDSSIITECSCWGSKGTFGGGGIYCTSGTCTITGGSITKNTTTGNPSFGGGIRLVGGSLTIKSDSINISDNEANSGGDSFYVNTGCTFKDESDVITWSDPSNNLSYDDDIL